MTTGVRGPIRPENQQGARKLEVGNSYFKITFTDAQVFFPAHPLSQADLLLAGLTVRDSAGGERKSLYKISTIKKNTAFHLGPHFDLTDWLPVASQKVTIELTYKITRGSPIKDFLDGIDNSGLGSTLSVFGPIVDIGTKVTEIVGHLVSFLKHEGKTETVFATMPVEFDVQKLETGYFVMIGSTTDETPVEHLTITENSSLRQSNGHELHRYSYAVFRVEMQPRRGLDAFKNSSWKELLQLCYTQAVNEFSLQPDDNERRRIRQKWIENAGLVRHLASNDQRVLRREVTELIREAQLEIEELSKPTITKETASSTDYPDAWQEILGVENEQKLRWAVQDYKALLTESKQLLQIYEQQQLVRSDELP